MRTLAMLGLGLTLSGPAARAADPEDSTAGHPGAASGGALDYHGLSLGLSLEDSSGLNAESENYSNVFTASLSPSWRLGKVLARGTYWEPLRLSASFSVSNEVLGNSDLFRGSQFAGNSGFFENNPEAIVIDDQGGVVDAGSVDSGNFEGAERRINYSDVALSLSHKNLYTIDALAARLGGTLKAVLPVSLSSRTATLRTALTASGSLTRDFLGDKLSLGLTAGATKYFFGSTTPGVKDSGGGELVNPNDPGQEIDPTNPPNNQRPGKNANFGFTGGLKAGYTISDKLSATGSYAMTAARTYGFDGCIVEIPGIGPEDVCANGEEAFATSPDGDWRNSQIFSLGASYDFNDWMGFSASLTTAQPVRQLDGHGYRQPFVNLDRNGFTSFGLSADFTIEKMVDAFKN